jgi:hypothetical protein
MTAAPNPKRTVAELKNFASSLAMKTAPSELLLRKLG